LDNDIIKEIQNERDKKNMLTYKLFAKQLLYFAAVLAVIMLALSLFGSHEAHAQNTGAAREGLGLTGDVPADGTAESSLGDIVGTVIDILSIVVGAVSVIMIIIGGLKYITSAGDSSGVQSAKQTILYAVVGLVIVIFAQVIVGFVLDRVGGTSTPPADTTPAGGYVQSYRIS
jgi:hypothetical protein